MVAFLFIIGWNAGRQYDKLLSFSFLAAGTVVPIGMWIVVLVHAGGISSLWYYYAATFLGAKGAVSMLSVPFPGFNWSHPCSEESGSALAYLVVTTTYLVGGATAVMLLYFQRPNRQRHLFLLGAVATGVALLPQALHRSDVHHLRQVLPPAIIAGTVLAHTAWWT